MSSGTSRRPLSVREFLSRSLLKAAGSSAVSVEAGTARSLPECRWLVPAWRPTASSCSPQAFSQAWPGRRHRHRLPRRLGSTCRPTTPGAVHTVLNTIYGHLPFLPASADVSAVAALAFDAQTASAVDAAPWLLRHALLSALDDSSPPVARPEVHRRARSKPSSRPHRP